MKQDITKKKRVNKTILEPEKEFDTRDDKKYKVKAIINNMMYSKKANNQISIFYYLVL